MFKQKGWARGGGWWKSVWCFQVVYERMSVAGFYGGIEQSKGGGLHGCGVRCAQNCPHLVPKVSRWRGTLRGFVFVCWLPAADLIL